MRKLFIIALFIFSIFTSVGCGCADKTKQIKKEVTEVFEFVKNDEFVKTEEYFHPDALFAYRKLIADVELIEKLYKIDFSDGLKIVRTQGFEIVGYTSEYKGSSYEMNYIVSVGERKFEMEVLVVDNDNGYGIYEIDFDLD